MEELAIIIPVEKKQVGCILNRAGKTTASTCFVIGHGASGDSKSGNLPAIAASLVAGGLSVLRYDTAGQLPARVKVLQKVLDSRHPDLKDVKSWILSGHSMGGRTACAVARQRDDVAAVALFSYPLHPPGKPDQLRDEDLTALQIPVLIIRGTKDPFSTEEPFQAVMERMASKTVEVESVEKGDHSLSSKTGVGKQRYEVWIRKVIQFSKNHSTAVDKEKRKPASENTDGEGGPKKKRQKN